MFQNYLSLIAFIYLSINFIDSTPLSVDDPCLYVKCPLGEICQKTHQNPYYECINEKLYQDPCLNAKCDFGEICQKSIDNLSYNCIKEKSDNSNKNFKTFSSAKSSENTKNLDYIQNYPCYSNPCNQNQICRSINSGKSYICVNELTLPNDINGAIETNRNIQNELKKNIYKIAGGANKKERVTSLKAKQLSLNRTLSEDKDIMAISGEINNELCLDQDENKKFASPLNEKQFIECIKMKASLRTCPDALVFNPFTESCSTDSKEPVICEPNPCWNDGKCIKLPKYKQKCECESEFTGEFCEKKNACKPGVCGANGECISIGFETPISHLCLCSNNKFIGLFCVDDAELNPCFNSTSSGIQSHATKLNPSIYIQCENQIPIIKTCAHPFVFSKETGECDWEKK